MYISWVYVYYINKYYLDMFYSILSNDTTWYGAHGAAVLIKNVIL